MVLLKSKAPLNISGVKISQLYIHEGRGNCTNIYINLHSARAFRLDFKRSELAL